MANILKEEFDAKDAWPIQKVTVYENRAQITRILDYKPSDAGEVELKLENLTDNLVAKTVRAEVLTKNAIVYEVSDRVNYKPPPAVQQTKRQKEISKKLAELRKEKSQLESKKAFLQNYSQKMIPTSFPTENPASKNFEAFLGDKNLSNLKTALESYTEKMEKLEEGIVDIDVEIKELTDENSKITTEEREKVKDETNAGNSREISVLLKVPEEVVEENGVVTVKLLYSVNGASWTAKYDMRVAKSENLIKLLYHGLVTNGSGEEWSDVELSLSTAKPSRAGNMPDLPRAIVKLQKKAQVLEIKVANKNKSMMRFGGKKGRAKPKMKMAKKAMNIELDEEMLDMDEYEASLSEESSDEEEQAMLQEVLNTPAVTNVASDGGGAAALFKLNHLCTVESDGKTHKQKIGEVEMEPVFTYVVSPQVSPDCFLRCTARNNSNLVFIPGPMAVFSNGSFVTTSTMKMVNKNEAFSVFLGVEDSVKIDYQPEQSKDEVTKGGLLGGKKHNVRTVTRIINIENTRNEDIDCLLFEQVPKSENSQVKVQLLKPDLSKESKTVKYKINKQNNLEARTKIKKRGKWSVDLTFKVEWPKKEKIVFKESNSNLAS